jgi:tRNA A-37 threonylcarbamoyl transferase component Bud32
MPDEPCPGLPRTEPQQTVPHIPATDTPARTDTSDPQAPLGTVAQSPADVARSAAASARAFGSPAVPGYEVLGELGRGGMGVVYKARHVKLNRTVALKMVLAGGAAVGRLVIRFLAEAEAVAAVKHPHVVQVYEYGEAGGLPFMALEYLPGGTLADRLARGGRADLVAAVAKVARGVAAAHLLGIVHRDLKPGNVLFDDSGEPKVADFGLAKLETGSDVTATGAVMGTPAYMSPEQAGGNTKFVGPQADVWALGVILYECLTGERPFRAEDSRGLLAAVMTADPPGPRSRAPSVPRDLELICLRCLSKAPHERYPTAAELADDLERFARHEPISIRPAGPLERAVKWVRRNQILAGALASVTLALVAGTAVSIAFALESQAEAARAEGEWQRAEGKAAELAKVNAELEGSLADAILSPLTTGDRYALVPLSPPEGSSLRRLAARRGTPVATRFLEQAARSPLGARQLAGRAEYAMHAAIGLDPDARDRADRLLLAGLADPATAAQQRLALATVCARWDSVSPELAGRAAAALVEAAPADGFAEVLRSMANDLEPLAARAGRERVRATSASAAALLVGALQRNEETLGPKPLADALVAASAGMGPGEAAAILADAVGKTSDIYALRSLAERLVTVTAGLPPDEARPLRARTLARLGEVMEKATIRIELGTLSRTIGWVAARVDPELARPACSGAAVRLVGLIGKEADAWTLMTLAEGLAAIAPGLEPDQAANALTTAVEQLTRAVCNPKRSALGFGPDTTAEGLAAVVKQLAPGRGGPECSAAAAQLADALDQEAAAKSPDPIKVAAMGLALVSVTSRLEPAEAAAACERANGVLLAAMGRAKREHDVGLLGIAVGELAARSQPAAAAAACSRAADILIAAVRRTAFPGKLAAGLVSVSPRLEPGRAVALLAEAMSRTKDTGTLAEMAVGLGAVAARVEPRSAAAACTRAAELLGGSLREITDPARLRLPAEGLAAVVPFIDPETAAGFLLEAMSRLVEPGSKGRHAVGDAFRKVALGSGPLPRPLQAQTLVDLLKHPFCVGEARRAVLDALAFTYRRKFPDQWEFVRFVRENNLPLDLLTPPQSREPR